MRELSIKQMFNLDDCAGWIFHSGDDNKCWGGNSNDLGLIDTVTEDPDISDSMVVEEKLPIGKGLYIYVGKWANGITIDDIPEDEIQTKEELINQIKKGWKIDTNMKDSLENLEQLLDNWMEKLNQRQAEKYPNSKDIYKYVMGKRWIKVIHSGPGTESAFAFVDPETGDIYKSATWNSPAKGARGNIASDKLPLDYGQLYSSRYVGYNDSLKTYKIKFKNGYTAIIRDSKNKSIKELYRDAKEAMDEVIKQQDANYKLGPTTNVLAHSTKIKNAIDKNGEVVNPNLLDYEIKNIEIDMNADLNHSNYKKYSKDVLDDIIATYEKLIDAVSKAKEEKYQNKVNELKDKLEKIKVVFGLKEDVKVEDVPPVADPTISYSLDPDPYFSAVNIGKAADWISHRDKEKKNGAIEILKNEYPALKQNLENDYNNAEELIENYTKDDLREFMRIYLDYINVYADAGLSAEYSSLKEAYNKLNNEALRLEGPIKKIGGYTRSVAPHKR